MDKSIPKINNSYHSPRFKSWAKNKSNNGNRFNGLKMDK